MSKELREYLKGKPRKRGVVMDAQVNFPRNNWQALRASLAKRGYIRVMRKNLPYGKYVVDDIVRAPWGENLRVSSVSALSKDEQTKTQKDSKVSKRVRQKKVEIIKLVPIKQ